MGRYSTKCGWLKIKNVTIASSLVIIGCIMATLNFTTGQNAQLELRKTMFESDSLLFSELLKDHMLGKIQNTETLSLIMNSGIGNRSEFNNLSEFFLNDVDDTVQAYEYIPKILNKDRLSYEQEQTETWGQLNGKIENLTIMELKINDNKISKLVPSSIQPFYYPITYIVPFEKNEIVILFDLYSSSIRRETMNYVLHTGIATITPRIELVQETGSSFGALFISLTKIQDFVSAVFRIDSLLEHIFNNSNILKGIVVILTDETETETVFLGAIETGNPFIVIKDEIETTTTTTPVSGQLQWDIIIDIGGRKWKIRTVSMPEFLPIQNHVVSTIIIILLFISLAGFYLLMVYNIEKKQESLKLQLRTSYTKWMGYMCHSIRGPIHTINYLSNTLLILGQEGNTEIKRLELLQANTIQLFDLVNSYIDFTSLDTSNIVLTKRLTDVCTVAENIFHEYTIMSSESVKMEIDISSNVLGTNLYIDSLRFRQILGNALSNAVKFTSSGFITLTIDTVDETYIEITIKDTGPGLNGRRYKGDANPAKSKNNMAESLGIGLTVSRYIASMMNGTIILRNRTDGVRGSEFILNIPYSPATSESSEYNSDSSGQEQQQPLPTIFSEVTIFACDDEFAQRYTLKDMLNSIGIKNVNILVFCEGEEMLEYLSDESTQAPHIILLDIFMKRMNGDEIFNELRKNGYTGPVIAVTGNVINIQDYLEQGFTRVLTKPFKEDKLKDILETILFSVV
jgi:signal transduction histidine kinase/CheY-like chemotaxis protein